MLYHSQSPLKVQSIRHILHNSAILIQPTQIQTAYTEKHIQPFLGQSRKASSRVLVKRAYESQELIKTSHSPAKSQDRTDRSMSRELNQGNTGQIVTIYFGERKYIGQTKKIYKHGIGTLYDKNSNIIYEGQWQDDKYHGLGTLNNNDKSEWKQYVGEFFYGIKQGAGIEYYKDGSYYVGNFSKGHKDGIGCLYEQNSKKSGLWLKDIIQEEF